MIKGRIGMRTLKTALSVILTLIISDLLGLGNPFFAVIAAIIAMEPSVTESFASSRTRIYGTVLGALMALLLSLINASVYITIGVGIVGLIYISNLLKWQSSIKVSTIVLVSILINYDSGNRFTYSLHRTLDTLLGLSVGTLINLLIKPPHSKKSIDAYLSVALESASKTHAAIQDKFHAASLESLIADLVALEDRHKILKKELKLRGFSLEEINKYEEIFENIELLYNHLSVFNDIDKTINFEAYEYHNNKIASHIQKLKGLIAL